MCCHMRGDNSPDWAIINRPLYVVSDIRQKSMRISIGLNETLSRRSEIMLVYVMHAVISYAVTTQFEFDNLLIYNIQLNSSHIYT